ncbi:MULTISPECIES: Zn-dependent alcohol dehydrogenase [Sphingomonas]|uniref:S-(Hydroxymethyl)glutathione dehydrogenase/alcohol dehydrogenase n=1 Tax=Sphingomonas leidyi TaxID=68569 RepID=A0A7X5UYE8_9SPHN|nr:MULTISPECIES: Zn-dependent alcohol dehydrogenase [Sphingomonas]MBN8810768.1 Zn-dependent alcohol dehydrogenase [Sphingomonas sp.]NIJ64493.1 S-(hydroxymethyl)glutathione dehydrogenase/alcohol dehydrogenase [Sphingomonas leidyi]OJY49330.1 MAG: alcohol dehydrogenase [Sphingomonas sp. 67-41]
MKAAVLYEAGKPLEITDVNVSKPGPREVLIRTAAVGVCRSDLHFVDGAFPHPVPTVPGHEAAGVIEAVGSDVAHLKVGDHVITFFTAFCGSCEMCVTGRPSLCVDPSTRRPADAEPRLSLGDGTALAPFLNLSAFAEQMLVHENACVAISKEMPLDRAALLGCAVITGAGSVFNDSRVRPGESVAVIGAGGIGLAAINAAKIAGAGMILAIDPVAEKRELALKLGATHALDAMADGLAKDVLKRTGGGVHYAIEAVGRPNTAELAWNILRRGGTATILGMIAPGQSVSLSGPTFLTGKKIQGSLLGSTRFPIDMPRLVQMYLDGLLDLDTMVAERIGLGEVNEALDKLRKGDSVRSVIEFA